MNNNYGKSSEFGRLIPITVATAVCIGMGVVCPISLCAGSEDAEAQPYAKVCLSVVTDAPSAKKEEVFKGESLPKPGTELVVHTVASEPCGLLVAAFSRENEDLAHGWRPEFVELAEQWKEVRVPKNTVDDKQISPLSPMPANFADQIPEKDFYDLLAYLLAQRAK